MGSRSVRNPLFPAPVNEAVQIKSTCWGEISVRVGQRIQFDVTSWSGIKSWEERVEGIVEELWEESWRDRQLVYAEVVLDDDTVRRAWFHRDHITEANGLTGKILADALW